MVGHPSCGRHVTAMKRFVDYWLPKTLVLLTSTNKTTWKEPVPVMTKRKIVHSVSHKIQRNSANTHHFIGQVTKVSTKLAGFFWKSVLIHLWLISMETLPCIRQLHQRALMSWNASWLKVWMLIYPTLETTSLCIWQRRPSIKLLLQRRWRPSSVKHANRYLISKTFVITVSQVTNFIVSNAANVTGFTSHGTLKKRTDPCVGHSLLWKRSKIMKQISEQQLNKMSFSPYTRHLTVAMELILM